MTTLYETGLGSVEAGSTAVSWAGLVLTGRVRDGDRFTAQGLSVRIASVDGDDTLTLSEEWPGATLVNDPCEITITPQATRLIGEVGTLLNTLAATGQWIVVDDTPPAELGVDGQFAIEPDTRRYWHKDGGVWVLRGALAGMNPRGAYDDEATYVLLDLVTDQSVSWVYISETSSAGNAPPVLPVTENDYWQISAGRGPMGGDGWSPVLSVVVDGERRVHQVSDWIGGDGDKPETGQFLGDEGFVEGVEDATDLRGPGGADSAVPGPPGQGLDFDVQVDELTDRDAYDGEAEGFRVLVSDVGDGSAAIYSRLGVSGWSSGASIGGAGVTDYNDLDNKPTLGTAAEKDVGTSAGNVVELDGDGKLPAVDGSQLTNLPIPAGSSDDLELTVSLLALQVADLTNAALGLGNRFADSFDTLTYVDVAGATNLDSGTAGVLKPTAPDASEDGGHSPVAGNLVNYTSFDLTWQVDNGATVTAISVYATSAVTGFVRIAQRTSAGNFTIVVSKAFSHTGSGWEQFTLTSSYTVPAIGAFYAGIYNATPNSVSSVSGGPLNARKVGDITGASSGWTEDNSTTNKVPIVRVHYVAGIGNIIVSSTAIDFGFEPVDMRVLARLKVPSGIVLNTDTTFEVSRDDGVTWSAAAVAQVGPAAGGMIVVQSDWIDVGGQPTGTNLRWRWKTLTAKAIELHDVYLSARE